MRSRTTDGPSKRRLPPWRDSQVRWSRWQTTSGVPPAGDVVISLGLSQHDLAALIGASRESAARALAHLRVKGLASTHRRSIRVRNAEGLQRLAGHRNANGAEPPTDPAHR
ncbi:Crp/Fnr family transcriptional regulator [Streptomyces sp. NPDC001046]|uniref:Crp/Fnr family transcriptional regulator n=1 Tax=Streptomyces sp. NPDC001046 TaxID=3364543 RepID=UPI003680DCA9